MIWKGLIIDMRINCITFYHSENLTDTCWIQMYIQMCTKMKAYNIFECQSFVIPRSKLYRYFWIFLNSYVDDITLPVHHNIIFDLTVIHCLASSLSFWAGSTFAANPKPCKTKHYWAWFSHQMYIYIFFYRYSQLEKNLQSLH